MLLFTARRYGSAGCAIVVCLSHYKKRLNIGSRKRYDSTGILCSFLTLKVSAKFQCCHPNKGAKYRWGRLKSAIFDQYLAMSQIQCKIGTYM